MLRAHGAPVKPPAPTGQEDQHHDRRNEDSEADQFGHHHSLWPGESPRLFLEVYGRVSAESNDSSRGLRSRRACHCWWRAGRAAP